MLKLILSPVTCTLIAIGIAAPTQVLAAPQDVTVRCVRKIERFEPLYKNDAAGRLAYISSAACNYKEVVGTGLFDGVHSTATGFTDLTNGRGDTRGITVARRTVTAIAWNGSGAAIRSDDPRTAISCAARACGR